MWTKIIWARGDVGVASFGTCRDVTIAGCGEGESLFKRQSFFGHMMTWHVHIRVVAPPGVEIHDFYVELNPKVSISVPAVGLISRRDAAKSEDFDAYRPTFRKNRRLRRA